MATGQTSKKKKKSRSSPLSEAEWSSLRDFIYHDYIELRNSSGHTCQQLLAVYQKDITDRQLKTRFCKWRWRKKITEECYWAMNVVFMHIGKSVNFVVMLTGGPVTKSASEVQKECNRKKGPAPVMTYVEAVKKLLKFGVKIYNHDVLMQFDFSESEDTGTDTDDDRADFEDSEDSEESEDGEKIKDRVVIQKPECDPARPYTCNSPSTYDALYDPLVRWWQHDHESIVQVQRYGYDVDSLESGTQMLNLKAQQGPLDEYSKWLLTDTLFMEPNHEDRLRRQALLGIDLGTTSKQWDGNFMRSQMASFMAYYLEKSLSRSSELDSHGHFKRRVAREALTQLMDAGTDQLLPALCWVYNILASCQKRTQSIGFGEDVLECITASSNPEVKYFRPIIEAGLRFDMLQSGPGPTPHAPLGDESLTADFKRSIAYLKRSGKTETGNYAILHTFLAWWFEVNGRPQEALGILLSQACLPLASRILGQYHVATIVCHGIASRCYRKCGNNLADSHLETAMLMLKNCGTPLLPLKHLVMREQAMLHIANERYGDAAGILQQMVKFMYSTFGACSDATWWAIRKLHEVLKCNGEAAVAEEMYREYYMLWEKERQGTNQ